MTSPEMATLLGLVLAHLSGDFLLQPRRWVESKQRHKRLSPALYWHACLHGLLTALVLTLAGSGLGIILAGTLFVAIISGFPIAFTLIILGIVFGLIGFGDLVFDLLYFQVLQTLKAAELAAVPLFLLMGYLLERANLMNRLFRAFQMMFATMKGSLYVATLLVSTLFAAATGIVGASVSLMGLMAAPAMQRSGYDTRLSAGTIAAGGTLGGIHRFSAPGTDWRRLPGGADGHWGGASLRLESLARCPARRAQRLNPWGYQRRSGRED